MLLHVVWMGFESVRAGELVVLVAAVWVTYIGLILVFYGIVVGSDTSTAGASPEEKRLGRAVAYIGAAIAGGCLGDRVRARHQAADRG